MPFWKELTDDELDIFFSELCGEFQDLEFLLYNNRAFAKRKLGDNEGADEDDRKAEKLKNIF